MPIGCTLSYTITQAIFEGLSKDRYMLDEGHSRLVRHLTEVIEDKSEDWEAIDEIRARGRLASTWELAARDERYACRFLLAVRRYCFARGLMQSYLRAAMDIP